MKTLDLAGKRITLDKVLELAAAGSVRILTADVRAFVLEKADDFEKECGGARQELWSHSANRRSVAE